MAASKNADIRGHPDISEVCIYVCIHECMGFKVDGQIVLETLEAQMYQAPAHVT